MSNSSRFEIDFLKGISSNAETYQRILLAQFARITDSRQLFNALTNRFTSLAEYYYVTRDFDSLNQVSSVLLNLPLSDAQQTGLYYQSFIKYRSGQKNEAQAQLEKVIASSSSAYQARALQTLGSFHYYQGKIDDALRLYKETSQMALSERGGNLLAGLMANLNTCHVLSDVGDHHRSLSKLENLWPLVHFASKQMPFYFYGYHNDLAVELGAVGRIAEAQSAISVALSSPYASAYPEWSETRDEVEEKRNYPDLSRCFIDRSLTESEAIPDSPANRSVEADATLEHERETEIKAVRVSIFCRFVGQSIYQIPVNLPNAHRAIIPGGSAQSILQRLGRCVQPRSPPARLYSCNQNPSLSVR